MKLLLDECLPAAAAPLLRDLGRDATHVLELGMFGASDDAIILFAVEKDYVVVTQDDDFSRMIATRRWRRPSLILLRLGPVDSIRASRSVHHACSGHPSELVAGCILTCDGTTTRVRLLPIR